MNQSDKSPKLLPPGRYTCVVTDAEATYTQTGKSAAKIKMQVLPHRPGAGGTLFKWYITAVHEGTAGMDRFLAPPHVQQLCRLLAQFGVNLLRFRVLDNAIARLKGQYVLATVSQRQLPIMADEKTGRVINSVEKLERVVLQ